MHMLLQSNCLGWTRCRGAPRWLLVQHRALPHTPTFSAYTVILTPLQCTQAQLPSARVLRHSTVLRTQSSPPTLSCADCRLALVESVAACRTQHSTSNQSVNRESEQNTQAGTCVPQPRVEREAGAEMPASDAVCTLY